MSKLFLQVECRGLIAAFQRYRNGAISPAPAR
jgi:hypothetical protein